MRSLTAVTLIWMPPSKPLPRAGDPVPLLYWMSTNTEIALSVAYAIGITAKGGLVVDIKCISIVGRGAILEASLPLEFLAFLEAVLRLDSEVNVALHVCANGGLDTVLTTQVKAAIFARLSSSGCGLCITFKDTVYVWLDAEIALAQ